MEITAAQYRKMLRKKPIQHEERFQIAACKWFKKTYPGNKMICDQSAGMNLGKKGNGLKNVMRSEKGLPDMYILVSRGHWSMLCPELKSEKASVWKKDGSLMSNEHLEQQAAIHEEMREDNKLALFVKGMPHFIAVVKWYMDGAEGDPPSYQQIMSDKKYVQTDIFHS